MNEEETRAMLRMDSAYETVLGGLSAEERKRREDALNILLGIKPEPAPEPYLSLEYASPIRMGRKTLAELTECLAEACGLDPKAMTKRTFSSVGTALKDIRTATPNVTCDEIKRRAQAFKRLHRDWYLSPHSLSMHWGEFAPVQQTTAAKPDLYTEPKNWRETMKRIYGDVELDGRQWMDFSPSTRESVVVYQLRSG